MDLKKAGHRRFTGRPLAARHAGVGIFATLALAVCGLLLAPAMASAAVGGSIEGEVTDSSTHLPIEGAAVCAYNTEEEEVEGHCAFTKSSGKYTIPGLSSGHYRVAFFADFKGLNYITQYYQDEANFEAAKVVPVTAPGATFGIDAEMHEGGQIKGEVTNASTLGAIKEIEVCALEKEEFEFVDCTYTGASGEYTLAGLPVGEYKIEFWPGSLNYITQYYNAKPSWEKAEPVPVKTAGETVSGINAAMQEGGQITGTVTKAENNTPLSNITVCALEMSSEFGRCAATNASGRYTISGLLSGSYKVEFSPEFEEEEESAYLTQYYNDEPTIAQADPVVVTAPATRSDINAALALTSTLWPASTGAPQLSGTATPGDTLFCSTGTWSNSPTSYSYKWLRNGTVIVGQSSSTYSVQSADLGAAISCQVTALNSRGSGTATSNILQVSAPPGPAPQPKALKCKKGFKKKKVHGKAKCVKVKKHKKHTSKHK